MTVIKDPGNQTESYLDGQVRMWRDTAGLWRGSARDTSGGAHPGGWASGQLWSATASQWQTHANTAYDSGTWGSGTPKGNYAYTGGVWGSGILWSTEAANRGAAAYDSGTWGVGTLWSTRYTNILPVAAASRNYTISLGNEGDHGSNEDVWAIPLSGQTTIPISGYYTITATWSNTSGNVNSRLDVRFTNSSGTLIIQATGAGNYRHGFYHSGPIGAGTAIWAGSYYSTGGFGHVTGGTITLAFQSTQEYPH